MECWRVMNLINFVFGSLTRIFFFNQPIRSMLNFVNYLTLDRMQDVGKNHIICRSVSYHSRNKVFFGDNNAPPFCFLIAHHLLHVLGWLFRVVRTYIKLRELLLSSGLNHSMIKMVEVYRHLTNTGEQRFTRVNNKCVKTKNTTQSLAYI